MSGRRTIAIVGAGLAGFGVVQALREKDWADRILLIGDEAGLPYDRPPLSKEVLLSGEATAAIDLCTADTLADLGVDVRHGQVVAIERAVKRLCFDDGSTVAYDKLVIATGGEARPLPGFPADGHTVFNLRRRDDALALSAAMRRASSILIVGAGWIGLEVASVARELGLRVTVADNADRVCGRLLPKAVSSWLEQRHRQAGVEFRLGSSCDVHRGADGFRLESDEPHDLLLCAIGMMPRDELARRAGITCDRGIVTDEHCRTSDPDVFAVGDVANAWQPALGQHVVRQSWKGALLDARMCAATLLDVAAPAREAPWFWSEQCGHMIQAAGWPMPDDALLSAEEDERPLWKYGRNGEMSFVVGIDRNRDLRMAHRQLGQLWASAHLVGELK